MGAGAGSHMGAGSNMGSEFEGSISKNNLSSSIDKTQKSGKSGARSESRFNLKKRFKR